MAISISRDIVQRPRRPAERPAEGVDEPGATMLPMPELTESQLLDLLRDPRCPVGIQSRSGQKRRLIGLPDLLAFVEQEVGRREGLEGEVDALMTALALERLSLIDWWSAPRRALRRIRGKRNPKQVGYEAPTELFHDSW